MKINQLLFYVICILFINTWSNVTFTKVITSSQITPSIDKQFTYIGILPYYRMRGDYYVALYKAEDITEYGAIEGKRKRGEKYLAQTTARIFFPLQQHRNIRTGSVDWNCPNYLATMIFNGPWSRCYLLTMDKDRFMYMVDVQRVSSLKNLRLHPMIIVKMDDLLDAINPARANDNFTAINVTVSNSHTYSIAEKFARSLSRGDNWNFLRNFACEDCK